VREEKTAVTSLQSVSRRISYTIIFITLIIFIV